MGALIDSSVLIAAERGDLDLESILTDWSDTDFALSAITASEFLHGVHRADSPERRSRREAFVETLLARLPILPFDLVAARVHARVWADLAVGGMEIGAHDLIIGATAMSRGLDVVTRDERSLPRIEGLSIVRW